jgi:hypothetical protein
MISTAALIAKYPKANNAANHADQPAKNGTKYGSDKEASENRAEDPEPAEFPLKKQDGDETKACPEDPEHKTAKNNPGNNAFDEPLGNRL